MISMISMVDMVYVRFVVVWDIVVDNVVYMFNVKIMGYNVSSDKDINFILFKFFNSVFMSSLRNIIV